MHRKQQYNTVPGVLDSSDSPLLDRSGKRKHWQSLRHPYVRCDACCSAATRLLTSAQLSAHCCVCVGLNPKDTGARNAAAELLTQLDQPRYADALAHYDAVVALHAPHGYRANGTPRGNKFLAAAKMNYYRRAQVFMKMGRYEEAKRGFDQAIKIDDSFSQAREEREAAMRKMEGATRASAE